MHRKSVAMQWRRFKNKYDLVGTECENCKTAYYPPRDICPECRRKSHMADKKFKGTGEVVSHTMIYAGPSGFEKAVPYAIVIVKLDEGPWVSGQLVDCDPEKIKIGMRVQSSFRKIYTDGDEGIIQYGIKFIPEGGAN